MKSIALIEDQKDDIEHFCTVFSSQPTDWKLDIYESPSKLTTYSYDCFFIDIEFTNDTIDGFMIANRIHQQNPSALLIFLTTHSELAIQGYKYSAFRFIPKCDLDQEFPEVQKALHAYWAQAEDVLLVENQTCTKRIKYCDIIYINSNGNYVDIHTMDEVFHMRATIKKFTQSFPAYYFFPSPSFFINVKQIDRILKDEDYVIMNNHDKIAISKHKKKALLMAYIEWVM